ncbi:MAG: hypothetical protein QOF34_697, partial [Sphingomonadales bacterium]|nr:hypothetical protein [Sphingomonadales bacterium]
MLEAAADKRAFALAQKDRAKTRARASL